MNVENILKVADAIERHGISDLGFNMSTTYGNVGDVDMSGHNCGTVACIGGWAVAEIDGTERAIEIMRYDGSIMERAQDIFCIDCERGGQLFVPDGWADHCITPAQAVRTLRHLAATGEVNWDLPEPA